MKTLLGAILPILLMTFAPPASAAAADRPVLSRVAPIYPPIAKRLKISGTVRLEVTVQPNGVVSNVKSVTGNRMLGDAAGDAVRKWRFAPSAEVSILTIEFNFAGGS